MLCKIILLLLSTMSDTDEMDIKERGRGVPIYHDRERTVCPRRDLEMIVLKSSKASISAVFKVET